MKKNINMAIIVSPVLLFLLPSPFINAFIPIGYKHNSLQISNNRINAETSTSTKSTASFCTITTGIALSSLSSSPPPLLILTSTHTSYRRRSCPPLSMASDDLDEDVCQQITIQVCSSTACTKKRRVLGIGEFATYGAMYERAGSCGVEVEESTCLGKCKLAPCVAIEHEDYEGYIGLEGMTDSELSMSMFTGVINEEDCDRIWDAVENGVRALAEMEDEDD